MIKTSHIAAAVIGSGLSGCASLALADFISDSKTSLELRNYYFSRDFRDGGASQSRREEWAQGFTLRVQSGFTEGPLGFGLDAMGMLGVKLDSSPDRSGTGLLPRGADKRAEDDYSKAALTAKARFAQSLVQVGGLSPQLPLLASNTSRLFAQVFTGAQWVSKDIDALTVTVGGVDSVKQRDSSNSEDLTIMSQQGAYSTSVSSDHLVYAGVDYQLLPSLVISYQACELEDFFRRDFYGVKFNKAAGRGKVFAEVRYFDARDTGQQRVGEIDNRTVSSNLGYAIAGHSFSGGYQKAFGDTAYAYVGGSDTYLFSEMQVSTFAMAREQVWMARYDYDFAALGVPGLAFNVRYVKGDEVDPSAIRTSKAAALRAAGEEGKEWERTTDIAYVVQDGPLKNLGVRWRYATNRSDYADSADEHRVILSYVMSF
ncbi:Porin-like protein NicP precursor [compost metagenome]